MGTTRMTILRKRLDWLERNRPVLGANVPPDLKALPRDVAARVIQAKADGTFPRSLCDADLEAVVALADMQGAI